MNGNYVTVTLHVYTGLWRTHTRRQHIGLPRASIASSGKNSYSPLWCHTHWWLLAVGAHAANGDRSVDRTGRGGGCPAALSGSTVEDRATLVDDMRYRNLMKFGRIVPDICRAGKSRFLGFRFFAVFSKQLKISISPKFRFVAFLNFHIFFSENCKFKLFLELVWLNRRFCQGS